MQQYVYHMGGWWSLTSEAWNYVLERGALEQGFNLDMLGRRLQGEPVAARSRGRMHRISDWSRKDFQERLAEARTGVSVAEAKLRRVADAALGLRWAHTLMGGRRGLGCHLERVAALDEEMEAALADLGAAGFDPAAYVGALMRRRKAN